MCFNLRIDHQVDRGFGFKVEVESKKPRLVCQRTIDGFTVRYDPNDRQYIAVHIVKLDGGSYSVTILNSHESSSNVYLGHCRKEEVEEVLTKTITAMVEAPQSIYTPFTRHGDATLCILHGKQVDIKDALTQMDPEIRECLLLTMPECTPQHFLDTYAEEHECFHHLPFHLR